MNSIINLPSKGNRQSSVSWFRAGIDRGTVQDIQDTHAVISTNAEDYSSWLVWIPNAQDMGNGFISWVRPILHVDADGNLEYTQDRAVDKGYVTNVIECEVRRLAIRDIDTFDAKNVGKGVAQANQLVSLSAVFNGKLARPAFLDALRNLVKPTDQQ